jgi:Protein of unknown function (DUF4065)
MSFNREKFKALVSYIVWKTGDVHGFGLTKLNKVLWFSDVRSYEAYGKSITGESYVRQPYGPVSQHAEEVINELIAENSIQKCSESFFQHQVKGLTANQRPDTSQFDADELGLIDWWIRHIGEDHTAVSISEMSHDYGWKIVPNGYSLPYKSFLAKRLRPPAGEELDWAMASAKELADR